MAPRNELIGWVVDARVGVEGVRVAGVGHSKIPVLVGHRRERVKHCDVCLNSDDTNSTLSNTVSEFVSLGCAFKSIPERGRDYEESLRAIVAFGVDANETVYVLGLQMEGKENGEFVNKFQSGSIFSIQRVYSPCGEVGE
jgi:hypothetical protein